MIKLLISAFQASLILNVYALEKIPLSRPFQISRRAFGSVAAVFPLLVPVVTTAETSTDIDIVKYDDKKFGVEFSVPSSWMKTDSSLKSDSAPVSSSYYYLALEQLCLTDQFRFIKACKWH
jgi:hypothetical protein